MTKTLTALCFTFALAACSKTYVNQQPIGQKFPVVQGEALDKKTHELPEYFAGRPVVLLLGYKQDGQFDIDRWLIGLDMTETSVEVYELPTVLGWLPRQIKGTINEGMRKGIPEELWSIVLTVYEDSSAIQSFTGNQNPNNARALLLNKNGEVVYFHDRGFSVKALNELRNKLTCSIAG